jgi:protein TonB
MLFAGALTCALFAVLPFMQHITRPPASDLDIREMGMANLPPPPPPPPEEEPEQEQEEEPPPELTEEAPPLDLDQLELALNPGFGAGMGGDFAVRLPGAGGQSSEEADAIFSLAELDQKPRVVYQPAPDFPAEIRSRKQQGTVYVLFVVNQSGSTVNPIVQNSTHPAFERPALRAVKRWRFEPGKRKGKPVQFKMRVPITFMSG